MAVLVKTLVEMGILDKTARKTLKVDIVTMTLSQQGGGRDLCWSY